MRRVATVTALAMLLMMAAAPAMAQDDDNGAYPPAQAPTCAADVGSPTPGQTVTIVCSGWAAGTQVAINFDGVGIDALVLATVTADDAGNLRAAVTIPSNVQPGPAVMTLAGTSAGGQVGVLELSFNIVAAGAGPGRPAPARGLPATGSEPGMALLTAFGLFAAGGAALYTARRRNAALGA